LAAILVPNRQAGHPSGLNVSGRHFKDPVANLNAMEAARNRNKVVRILAD